MVTRDVFTHQADYRALKKRIEHVLERTLPAADDSISPTLANAMRYSTLGGGKRIRAIMVYMVGRAFGTPLEALDKAAAAVELIHAYTLIHDDLPAMDNDEWRRGKPSCHIAYGHATAILAGDALQTRAFAVLAEAPLCGNEHLLVSTLAEKSGYQGIVGGQAQDIANTAQSTHQVLDMHARKTGALFECAARLAGLISHCDTDSLTQLEGFAKALGLAFQLKDDLLDVDGKEDTLGKTTGIDATNQRCTSMRVFGRDATEKQLAQSLAAAKQALLALRAETQDLSRLCDFVAERHA